MDGRSYRQVRALAGASRPGHGVAAGPRYRVRQSPPGSGRLLRIPLFRPGETVPGIVVVPDVLPTLTSYTLTSRSLPYARLQLLGLQAHLVDPAERCVGYLRALRVYGGPPLFFADVTDWTPASAFLVDLPLAGLRAYPEVSETNQVVVDVAVGAPEQYWPDKDPVRVSLDVWLICDVLDDELIGPGDRGPYVGGLR